MFFGSSVYKEIITTASERLAGFNAFIFPSEIGSAFVTITHPGNWGRGRRYLGSFSVWVPLESMAAQHWMWGAVSKSPCLDEWEVGSIKQPSISPAAGHGGPPAPLHAEAFACENPSTQGKLTSGITRDDTQPSSHTGFSLSRNIFLKAKAWVLWHFLYWREVTWPARVTCRQGQFPALTARLHFSLILM